MSLRIEVQNFIEHHPRIATIAGLGGISLTVLGIAGCSSAEPNYGGIGNEFEVTATVHSVQQDGTINVLQDELVVDSANGLAATWFEQGKGQHVFTDLFFFEPSYNEREPGFFGKCENTVQVGRVFDSNGNEISPQDLEDIQVTIDGTITNSANYIRTGKSSYCDTDDLRPIFTEVRVIPR